MTLPGAQLFFFLFGKEGGGGRAADWHILLHFFLLP